MKQEEKKRVNALSQLRNKKNQVKRQDPLSFALSKRFGTINDVSTSLNSSAFPPWVSLTLLNTHTQMQAYTQTQAGKEIAIGTLISKHWQLIMRVTSSVASGWVVLTASQHCVSARGDLKRCLSLTARPRTYRCFHTHNTHTYAQTSQRLRFKVDFCGGEDKICLKSWHMEETQYWALVYWGLWVVSGWYTESCCSSQLRGGLSLRREFKPSRHQYTATGNKFITSQRPHFLITAENLEHAQVGDKYLQHLGWI